MVVVTGLGDAAAGVATPGAALVTVTVVLPVAPPPVAVTVAVPVAAAVYRPAAVIDPTLPAPSENVIVGCTATSVPNWSDTTAPNCNVVPGRIACPTGVTATVVGVWATVTVTVLVAVSPAAGLVAVTANV